MKAIVRTTAIAIALVVPALSSAQTSNGPLTRDQVRAQLIELEHAGYNPAHGNRGTYPAEIQAAEARVAAKHNGTNDASATGVGGAATGVGGAATGVGGTATGTAETGHTMPAMTPDMSKRSMFGHH
ncbi:DUF4148 domain-containing protein [Paraburkholderia sp. NMBU_R16]|uniref:DUF4148 domain-containing protein n=1 Tax=Paraburkholderia sp. NMBU_R16 TaxID=2698676 RepID=UPI0015674306|nr:DUF4148 domain-containing protein [Paraburkholderia sp. NMBU_R16]NRO96228.1 DUF4148 domain-containing protein [Paraburkholderia sp. NMBU_R16]